MNTAPAETVEAAELIEVGSYAYRINGEDFALYEDANGDLYIYRGEDFRPASTGELVDL